MDLRMPARPSAAAGFSLRLHGIFVLTSDRPGRPSQPQPARTAGAGFFV
jgi:hypothetical protein